MDRRCNVVLLSTLVALVFCGPAANASVVGTIPNVTEWKGEDIRLRCDIQEQPRLVYWVKETISHQQIPKARFFAGNYESLEERFDIDNNFSLVITDLEVADEGLYHCQVELSDSQIFENSTSLTVNSMASQHVIEECVGESQSDQSQCTYQFPSNSPSFNLKCVVSGFKPNISMMWTEESGKRLDSVLSQQTTLSDDTYERIEAVTVSAKHGTEQTFLCTAIGDSLEGTSTTGITVLPLSGKNDNLNLIIGLAVGLPFAVFIIILLVGMILHKYYPKYLRKGCGWNPCRKLCETQRPDVGDLMTKSPSCSSLTKKQIQQIQRELKAYYYKTRRKVAVDPLNFMERVILDEICTRVSLFDQTDSFKTPTTYEELLTNDESRIFSRHLLIEGEGGVGKTTLCSKIAWDWCQGRILQNLDMVIVIPLQSVTVNETIGDIVERYLSSSNTATPYQIDEYISKNQNKVLLVFDGFDEFKWETHEKSSSELNRIVGLEQYESCMVIVTSRPWKANEFRLIQSLAGAYTFITVEGFEKKMVTAYIKRYFRIREKDSLGNSLVRFMEGNDVIRDNMAPFPIYCAMLCLMWNDVSEERRIKMTKMQTFSEIFGEMISFLKEHYASKGCENLQNPEVVEHVKEANRAIQGIGEGALAGLLEKNYSFPKEQFTACHDAIDTCCKVGVLTIKKNIVSKKSRRDANISSFVVSTVSFPHILFQEYIAGVRIANLFDHDPATYVKVRNELLRRHKEFRFLLYFASSLGKEIGADIINSLTGCADQYFCVDVAFECHIEESCRSVGEKWKAYKLSQNTTNHTKLGIAFIGHCNQVQSLIIDNVDCGRTLSRDLADSICSSRVLRSVEIRDSLLHADFYMVLSTEASNCRVQELKFTDTRGNGYSQSQSSMEHFARYVCTMPCLLSFSLESQSLPDNFLSAAATSASSCRVQKLKMTRSRSTESFHRQSLVGESLARWVCTMPRLEDFTLSRFQLSPEFLSTTADLAASCQIQNLKLILRTWDDSSESSMEHFAQWLCTMSRLSRVSLECPLLPNSFLSTAATSASSCQIQSLELSRHFVGERDDNIFSVGGDLARWMCNMPSLSNFSVAGFILTDEFFSTIADLASSCQVHQLSMEIIGNDSEQSAIEDNLVEFLRCMPNLAHAGLEWRNVPATVFTKIASQVTFHKQDGITINGKPLFDLLRENEARHRHSTIKSGQNAREDMEHAADQDQKV